MLPAISLPLVTRFPSLGTCTNIIRIRWFTSDSFTFYKLFQAFRQYEEWRAKQKRALLEEKRQIIILQCVYDQPFFFVIYFSFNFSRPSTQSLVVVPQPAECLERDTYFILPAAPRWWTDYIFRFSGGHLNDEELDGHDVWRAISNGDASPRTEILHNIDSKSVPDTELGFSYQGIGLRVGDMKLLMGVRNISYFIPPEERRSSPANKLPLHYLECVSVKC